MDKKAVTKARSRLRSGEGALRDIQACTDFDTFMEKWYIFLVAAKSIYTVLEQGAKVSPQSRQWYGGKARVRRNDDLLQYVFQARNDEEHGIEPVAEHVPGGIKIGVNKPGFSQRARYSGSIGPKGVFLSHIEPLDGKPVLIEVTNDHVRLKSVMDLAGKTYNPPTFHRGQVLTDNSPARIAALALSYLSELVEEADNLS